MGIFEPVPGRLFRSDLRIAINTARATFAGWQDRLIAAAMLMIGLASLRSWFVDTPWKIAAWTALGAGILVGLTAGRLVSARLGFHGYDGVLATDALHPTTRRPYALAWHCVGIATLAAMTPIVRPSLLIVSVPAYLSGAFLVHLSANLVLPAAALRMARPGWTIRRWLRHPGAGIVAAMILLSAALWARMLGTNALIAIIGSVAILLALMLTLVDDGVVRFRTLAGHGGWRIIAYHAQGMLVFMAVTVPICLVTFDWVSAGILLAASTATLLLLAARVLAYSAYAKRFADLLVSIQAGVFLLVAYAAPPALPLVAIAMLWHLHSRGRKRRWLLA